MRPGAVVRLRLDRWARRLDGGRVLCGGSPLTVFRLGPGGVRVVDAIERGEPVPAGSERLVARLLDTGAAHPVWEPSPGESSPNLWRGESPANRPPKGSGTSLTWADVTLVIPALGAVPAALLNAVGPVARVIVVDDGSPEPLVVPGAEVVRLPTNAGPAAARNAGLALVTTPAVAFLDTDTRPRPGWLDPLLAHLDDPQVGLAAPRITTPAAPSDPITARYDATRSPLDLGAEPGRIAAGTRISYVPAAALVVRTEAARSVGGFDEALLHGEDVDFVWRLDEAGWRGRYEPASTVDHLARPSVPDLARQRFAYGRAAGPLGRHHPNALAPVRLPPASLAGWLLTAAGHPVLGVAVALSAAVPLARRLPLEGREAATTATRLAVSAHLGSGERLASALTRPWWPAALTAAIVSRRARPAVAAAILVPAALDHLRRRPPGIDPVRTLALRLVDDVAYGSGVLAGSWAARTTAPLRPRLAFPRPGPRRTARRQRR